MEIEPGTVVAKRYKILRPIGRGGMGEVFAAEHTGTRRPVAVKLLRSDSKSKSSAVERFRREARAAGAINSDHVTQVLDVEEDPDHGIVIVFELLEGESLIDRLKRTGPISFEELHPIIEDVWVGLSDAHKAGVIHRDLKPSNVFLERRPDGQQRVKLLDFGISKLPKEMGGETLTEMGQSLGTFSFMPPEQIGRAKTVDHRADIYAATTMIYQSLTGQLPYVARNILVMVEMKNKTNPRPLAEAMGHAVDQALEQFVARGLARNPADRFQSALEALEEWRKLKSLTVPVSRRPITAHDLNGQARSPAATPASPMPAVGRSPSSAYNPAVASQSHGPAHAAAPTGIGRPASAQSPTGIGRTASAPYALPTTTPTGIAPAPVAPARMLEPVMPGSLPRLDYPTESTTDISHIEVLPSAAADAQAASKAGGIQRGQELRPGVPPVDLSPPERKGPAGTRVMPPSVSQQVIAYAAAQTARSGTQGGPGSGPSSPVPQSGPPASPQVGRHPSQIEMRAVAPPPGSSQAPGTGAHAVYAPQGAPAPPPNPTPPSGIQPTARSLQMDPRASALGAPLVPQQQSPTGIGVQQSPTGIGAQQSPTGIGVQQSPTGIGRPASSAPPPVQLATMRLPDDPSSIPASQDTTTVYRPKKQERPIEKKKPQSMALFVIGAIAFAIVGFGIVYVVQLVVKSIGH